MAGLKKFQLLGVDLKSNDLVRSQLNASDSRNCTKTIKGDIDKRNGYEQVESVTFELEKAVYWKTGDSDIFIKSDGTVHKLYSGARQSCSIATLFPNVGVTVKNRIIAAEYLNNIYLTTSDGNSSVIKFDGSDAYLAGIPAPLKVFAGTAYTFSTGGTGYYFRFFYGHKDLNGNITFGPFVQDTSSSATPTITVSTFKTANPYGAFYNKYLIATGPIAITVDASVPGTSNKIPYTATNYVVGDELLIDDECLYPALVISGSTSEIRQFRTATITAIGGGYVTLDPADLANFSFTITSGGNINIDSRSRLYVFKSLNESFGYQSGSSAVAGTITQFILDNSADNIAASVTTADPDTVFEDIYDEEGQKIRPPKCRYITPYGDQLVYGNIVGIWDQENNFEQFNNNDIILYSDFGIGDNGETNSANIQIIGESFDGEVTGLRRCNDMLVVSKNNSMFSLDGLLAPDGYALRKIPTNYIGCESHNSILEVEGGLMFHGNDGIYFTDGVGCRKVTEDLDPLFVTMLTTRSISTVNRLDDKFLFYMTDGSTNYCLAFDYHFKTWFIWDSLDMSRGLYQKNDGTVVFAKEKIVTGTPFGRTYKFNSSYSDDGSAIVAYWSSNWEDLKEPSVDKKFKSLRLWNLNSTSTVYSLVTQKNWTNTDLETVTCTLAANSTLQKFHDQKNIMSLRYIFKNSTLNQNMLITGYEMDYEATQRLDKGN